MLHGREQRRCELVEIDELQRLVVVLDDMPLGDDLSGEVVGVEAEMPLVAAIAEVRVDACREELGDIDLGPFALALSASIRRHAESGGLERAPCAAVVMSDEVGPVSI